MTLPNFFIAGAAKSGTSALAHFLGQHPQIHMPYKEPGYFSDFKEHPLPQINRGSFPRSIINRKEYEDLYREENPRPIRLDASVMYLTGRNSARAIKGAVKDAKILIVLRQPVERAFSHFNYQLNLQRENIQDFTKCIATEPQRIAENWHPAWRYMELSKYPPQITRYLNEFSPEQLRIHLYEDWNNQPEQFWGSVMNFIGADPGFKPEFSQRYNITKSPRINPAAYGRIKNILKNVLPQAVKTFLNQTVSGVALTTPKLDSDLKFSLTEKYFKDDIMQLQDILKRDLSHWLL